jgi:pimeloyl-ACP methyl ester carboxylesterase
LVIGLTASTVFAQVKGWPTEVKEIQYRSAADQTDQPALCFQPDVTKAAPLLVGLHTWSSNYRQASYGSPYAKWCIEKKWTFIYPNFRGPNRNPAACGSELVVKDIVSAVEYAKKHSNVDANRIYLIGASGGGHCALLMAGRHPEIWAGVSAWVPITDLAAWHAECKKSKRKYWKDIEASCGIPGNSKVDEQLRLRSPLTWLHRAKGVSIDINAGIRDGHSGSVPISHSLRAFNVLAAPSDRIANDDIRFMTDKAEVPLHLVFRDKDPAYGKKSPLLRSRSGRSRMTIFNGGHEIIATAGLQWLSDQRKAESP